MFELLFQLPWNTGGGDADMKFFYSDDKVGSTANVRKMEEALGRRAGGKGRVEFNVLEGVGHWTVFEDVAGVTKAVKAFL